MESAVDKDHRLTLTRCLFDAREEDVKEVIPPRQGQKDRHYLALVLRMEEVFRRG
jgi:hypothetical protein